MLCYAVLQGLLNKEGLKQDTAPSTDVTCSDTMQDRSCSQVTVCIKTVCHSRCAWQSLWRR